VSTSDSGGDENVRDFLTVEKAEMLKMVEQLQRVVDGLQDAKAGVSPQYAEDLARLREAIESAHSPSRWRFVMDFASEVLARLAAELLKAWI
jgi:hypothetical protein